MSRAAPIVAYRWFRVTRTGGLAGAQGVCWPQGAAMLAGHVPGPALEELPAPIGVLAKVGAGLAALAASVMACTVVWLVVLGAVSAASASWGVTARAGMAAGVCVAMAAAFASPVWLYWNLHRPAAGHKCPARPLRLAGRWLPACGIHAYSTFELAARAAARTGEPVVLGRVLLWGRVFPHTHGYRAEWARLDALADDGSGRAVLPGVLYRVPVEEIV